MMHVTAEVNDRFPLRYVATV
ncbi:hypothetical protein NOCA2230098 [metagenome]|uniref:Uncharacterized protein n=1 Tax=metagenome TaxID=256318 RepID=A0A2P2BZH7_9ZZZZ